MNNEWENPRHLKRSFGNSFSPACPRWAALLALVAVLGGTPSLSLTFLLFFKCTWLKQRRTGGKYQVKTMLRAPASASQLLQGLRPAQQHLGDVGPTGCGRIPKGSQGLNIVWEEHAEVTGRCKAKSPSGAQAESP